MLKLILIKVVSLVLALSGLLVIVLPVWADGPPPDDACRGCHVGNTNELTLPSGEALLLNADIEILAQSAHGSHAEEPIYCTDCHRSRTRYLYPHQPNPAQTRLEFAADAAQNCRRCHEPIQKHNPGHLLAQDNSNLPTCVDCHSDGHAMTPIEILTADPIAACQICHETYDNPQAEAVHQETVTNLEADQTCQTCHTDTPVYPADVKCKACHGLLESEMSLKSGDTVSLRVDTDLVYGSVHGQHQMDEHNYTALLCTDCHRDQARYKFPHEPVTPFNERLFSIEMSNLCRECHEDVFDKQLDSSHAEALNNGKIEAAVCADCHGSHDIQIPNEPREQISKTCAQCHAEINENYSSSIHGAALLGENNPDVPVCIDCHGVHDINDPTTIAFRTNSPQLCAECHTDEELMSEYDISAHVFDTYVADFHGTTLQLFEPDPASPPRQAVCFDCHGIHDIKAVDDPEAGISIKENMLVSCQKCHEEATINFPDAWLAHYEPSKEEAAIVYYTELFFVTLTVLVMIGLITHIGLDFLRLIINKVKGQGA